MGIGWNGLWCYGDRQKERGGVEENTPRKRNRRKRLRAGRGEE